MPQNPFEEFMRQQAQPVNEFDSFVQKEAKPKPVKPTQPKTVQKIPTRGPVRPQGPAPTFGGDPTQQMMKDLAARPITKQAPNPPAVGGIQEAFSNLGRSIVQGGTDVVRDAVRRSNQPLPGTRADNPINQMRPRYDAARIEPQLKAVEQRTQEALPVNPETQDSYNPLKGGFWRKTLPAGVGSTVLPMAAGALTRGRFGGGSGVGMVGSMQNSAQTYDEALAATGDPKKAAEAADIGAAIGALEQLGLGRTIEKLGLARPIARRLAEMGEEGAQEAMTEFLNNVNAKIASGYDPERAISQGVLEAGFLGSVIGGGVQAADAGISPVLRGTQAAINAPAVRAIEQEQPVPLNLTASRPGGTPTTVIPLNPTPEQAAQMEGATEAINQSAARTAAEAKADEILSLPDDDAKRQALKDAEDDPLLNEVLYQRVNQEIADIQADPSLTPVQKAQEVANARQVLAAEGIDLLPNVPAQGTPIQDRLAARPGGPVEATPTGLTPEQQTAEVLNRQLGDEQIQVEQAKAQLARQREAQRQQSIAQAEMLNRQLAQETEVERVARENEQAFEQGFAEALDYEKQARDLTSQANWNEALVALAEQKGTLTALWSNLPREMKTPARKRQIDGELERIRQNRAELLRAQKNPRARQEGSFAPQFLTGEQRSADPAETGEAFPDLLQTVRRLGGMKTDGGTYGGEIAGILSNKESGTTGLVNNRSGMDLDYMREALVGEGAIPPETTNSELLEMLDMAVRNKDGERPAGTIDEQLVAHIEEQARQAAEGGVNPFEEFMRGESQIAGEIPAAEQGESQIPANNSPDWTARNAEATQASEDRRPPMGLGPERSNPARSDVSYSPYNDLVTNNRELVDQLFNMPLDEGANDRLEEGLAKIQEWADRRGIEQRHVDALEAYVRSEHLARAAAESSSEEDFIGWIDRQVEEGTAALIEQYGIDAVEAAEIAIEREVAALDAFYSDENTIDLFNKAKAGNDAALRRLTEYAEQEYGISGQIIADTVRAYRLATEASRTGPARVVKTAAQIAVDETAFEDVEAEVAELLQQPIDGLTPADIDPYLETLEAWRNRSITRDDVPAHLVRALRTKMADVNELRHIMVKAKQVPPKFRNRTLNKEQAAEKAERNKQKAEEARQRQREVRERERKRGDEPIMLPQQREALKALEGRTEPYPTLQFMSNFGLRRLAVEDLIDLGLIREVEGGVVANKPTAPADAPLVKQQPKQTEEEPFPQLTKPLNMPLPEPELPGRNKKNESLKMRVPQPPNYRPVNFEEPAPTFYSALERFVADKKFPNKASGAQMLGMIQKPQSGVKADEVKWLGLEDWLRSKDSVTKDEVLDFIRANNVKVEEVVKDENQGKLYRELKEAQEKVNNYNGLPAKAMQAGMSQLDAMNLPGRLQDGRKKVEDLPVEIQETAREFLDSVARYEELQQQIEAAKANKPKYQQYTIPGATEGSYRELLLTMPSQREFADVPPFEQWVKEQPWYRAWQARGSNTVEAMRLYDQWVERAAEGKSVSYKSSHWSEPNILAHIRFNERTDADGKRVLFVEEIQSDWAQEGRKKGFRGNENANDLKKEAEPFMRRFYNGKGDMSDAAWQELSDKVSDYERRIQAAERGVPNMPFPKTDSWAMLAFKRVLRHAAENGYDRIAWTTGEQQAERYDLSKQIKSLSYNRLNRDTADEQVSIIATGLDGERVIQKVVKPEELEDVVGKELATKILEDPKGRGELTGLDLKVGSEGMKGFYDAILPAAVNKYLKKWGVKAKEGKARADDRKGGDYIVLDKIGLEVAEVDTLEDARRLVEAGEGASYMQNRRYSPAYSIDITPEMRASVMQGQSLFFREGKRIDRTVTTPSGRKRSAKTPEFLTKGEIPSDAQGENYNKVYENIGGEFAQNRRKNVPGTLYLNDHATWVLDEVELSMLSDRPEYANVKPHAYGGATVLLDDAQRMADILRDRADNLWADSPDIQKNINGLADLIEEAITDARANGGQNSIEIVNASKDYSEILPEEYQSYLDSQKKTRRHESAHIWQTKIDPNRPGLLANSETADDVYYEKIRNALYDYYPKITHDQVYSEAFAFISSGDWARAGLTKEEAAKWLNYYFTKIAKKYGRAALVAGPKRMHPMTKGILEQVRGSREVQEETRNFKRWTNNNPVVDPVTTDFQTGEGFVVRVYHGTPKNAVEIFDKAKVTTAMKDAVEDPAKGLFFFAAHKSVADSYARKEGGRGTTQIVYVRMNNPYVVDARGSEWLNINYEAIETATEMAYPQMLEVRKIHDRVNPDGDLQFDEYPESAQRRIEKLTREITDAISRGLPIQKIPANNYDGIVIKNVLDSSAGDAIFQPTNVFIAFYPTQIKSATGNNGEYSLDNPSILKTKGITNVSERTRRDQGANGRSVETAPRESLKIRRPDRGMGQRQDAEGAGSRDTGSAGQNRGGEGGGVKPPKPPNTPKETAPASPGGKKPTGDAVIDAINAAKEAEREKKARPSAKPIRIIGELYHASRTILASSDLSALRQGMFMSLPPTQWPKAWKAMRTMFGSLKRSNYDGFKAGLEAHPDYKAAQEAGLFFATADADKMTDREESFISEWASNLPVVKQSEQAFKSYLDSLRIDTFTKYKRALDSRLAAGAITDVQYGQALREAAYWINTSTGRGSVRGKVGDMINTGMPVASAALFAPRYLISRFQLLNPITYGRNVTDAGKRVIFRNQMAEMFQSAAVLTAIGYGASLLGATVNWDDPDDSDWLKIKFGNTRFDALAGVQQVARLAYNIGNWLKTEATEEDLKALRDMRGSTKNRLLTFGRTKLAPVPSFFVDWFNDWKNVIGEQRKPFEFLKKEGASAKLEEASKDPIVSRYLPLLWSDMVEAYVRGYREGGATVGARQAAKFSPAIFGIGVQDYERKPNILSVGETSAPLAESLKSLGLKFESVRAMPGESPEQLRERTQKINVWMDAYGEALVKNPRFKNLTPEQQKAAIENLRGRIGGEANRKTPRLSRFNAASVIAGTLKGAEQKRKRAAGNIYNPPE